MLGEYELRKKANEITVEQLKRLLLIQQIQQKQNIKQLQQCFDKILQRGDCITLKELAVTGEDLIKLGMAKGKQIGNMLHFLLDVVHKNPEKNSKEILLQCAKENKNKLYSKKLASYDKRDMVTIFIIRIKALLRGREMEYNYEKILWEGYGLRFYGGNRIRTGYLCKTDKGLLEIRKILS